MAAVTIVAIQPMGALDPKLVRAVAKCIEATFAVRVRVLPVKELPDTALYLPRMRFRGERLIHWLGAARPPRVASILGLMSRDVSVTKGAIYDWGVIGVASPSVASGLVSTFRLGRNRAPASLVMLRLTRVALHELGHTFGLPHCKTPGCIMNDAYGAIATIDESSGTFCAICRGRLKPGALKEPDAQ